MTGGLSELSRPEGLVQIRRAARAAAASALSGVAHAEGSERDQAIALIADQAARGVVEALSQELGPGGEGPLAQSLYATSEKLSASTVRGVQGQVGELFPACRGPHRDRCVQERITELSRSVSAGLGTGLRHAIAPPVAIIAFFLGILVALAMTRARAQRRHTSSG